MSDNQAILIFGAGMNQLELIHEARAMGLISVVVDPQFDPPGRDEADFFYQVSGSDYELTKEIAIRHKVRGIVTGQMEKPLKLMAKLAVELGFVFNSPDVTSRCIDKWQMKEAFRAGDIAFAEGILIKPSDTIPSELPPKIKFPLIIKPRDSYSSRGVYKCDSPEDLRRYISESRSFSSNGDVLLEEFIEGREYSVEAMTFQGETNVIQFTEKFITPYPRTVETGHLQPADLTGKERECIAGTVIKALRALGIENSASHTEIRLSERAPVIIETGARLGGDFIASYLTLASTGVSMDRAAIQIALGMKPDLQKTRNAFSMIRFPELPAGKRVIKVDDTSDIEAMPGVVFARLFLKPGDVIAEISNSAHRPGCIIVEGHTREEVTARIELYSKMLAAKAGII